MSKVPIVTPKYAITCDAPLPDETIERLQLAFERWEKRKGGFLVLPPGCNIQTFLPQRGPIGPRCPYCGLVQLSDKRTLCEGCNAPLT